MSTNNSRENYNSNGTGCSADLCLLLATNDEMHSGLCRKLIMETEVGDVVVRKVNETRKKIKTNNKALIIINEG